MSSDSRAAAIGLVMNARMGAVEEGSTFEYLLGLRDAVRAWLAEIDVIVSEKVQVSGPLEFPGCAVSFEDVSGDHLDQEDVRPHEPEDGDVREVAEADVGVAVEVREPVTPELPGREASSEQVSGDQEEASASEPEAGDTRGVAEVEWPSGMAPSPNGVGWVRRGGTPGPSNQAAERVCELAASHATLVEIGRAYKAIMRGGDGAP